MTASAATSSAATSPRITKLRLRLAKRRPLPRGQDEQETAVLVVGREDVRLGRLGAVALGVHRDRLVEHAHAPLERRADVVVAAVLPLEPEHLLNGAADHVLVAEPGQLARAAARADQAGLLVADEERRV